MDKITDRIASLPRNATFFSLEFFPPKTEAGTSNLQARLSRMARALRPLFVNVTWGAGGSTSARSLELAGICQQQLGLTTCLHLTCTNMSKKVIDEALREAKDLGIRNILALRGDPPRSYEYGLDEQEHNAGIGFVWASDLVRYIRKEYGGYFCIGVAGYPEGHSDESNPSAQDPRADLPYLVKKIEAGADFIMTQLFYDVGTYLAYERMVEEWDGGVIANVPIIPGLMPVQSYSVLKRTTKLSHAKLPPDIASRFEPVKEDDEEVKRVGVDVISEIVEGIKARKSPRPRGFHFYTLNLEKAVSFIVERCALIPPLTAVDELDTALDDTAPFPLPDGKFLAAQRPSNRRPSSPHNHLMDDASTVTSDPPSRATTLAITHGVGSLGREATWDDYPNGRFGDARSPAFGEIDGYGTSIHMSPARARAKWDHPQSRKDIGLLFIRYLHGELDQLPWSEGTLSAETKFIERELCALVEKRGWWSVASQPAVDGLPSDDKIFGWGPKDGFVFQKAFVEFFIPAGDWHNILRPYLSRPDIAPLVSWYASPCTSHGGTSTETFTSSSPPEAVHSVTWGAFPGKEIVTPTIIEEISFKAWAEEAFNIWAEWERCYAPGSKSWEVLKECRQGSWLVNVIGHGYKEVGELWDILMNA